MFFFYVLKKQRGGRTALTSVASHFPVYNGICLLLPALATVVNLHPSLSFLTQMEFVLRVIC